jgi:hypothetical protein
VVGWQRCVSGDGMRYRQRIVTVTARAVRG